MIKTHERVVLRELGRRIHDLAADPVNDARRALWRSNNALRRGRPPVYIFEIPWHELECDVELTPVIESDGFLRELERGLRRTIYQWNHMPGDMVVEDYIVCASVIRNTGFGISEDVDIERTDPTSDVVSRTFNVQIRDEHEIDKIKNPAITFDAPATAARYDLLCEIFDGVIPVRRIGVKGSSIAPWDFLVRLTGVEQILLDMYERPEYVHRLIGRMTDAFLAMYDQYETLNLLDLNNDNTHMGGGYCYTDELPAAGHVPGHVRPCDMWGRTMSQIFSSVSPAMHDEFALQYELKFLRRFGLVYYGCCEPLHNKIHILRKIPRLRSISMSPWINLDQAVDNIGKDFVFSHKANPALLAGTEWNPAAVRADLRRVLDRTRECVVEIILKDISTVGHQPRRLWEWARIASEVAAE